MKGKVYLVGAGPGDYKLITLKGLELIRKADVVIYDRLANEKYLKEVKKDCELIYVGKQSCNHTLTQDNINQLIVKKAKNNNIVVRLKGGDPYVFGRGGEEGEELFKNNIDFEVVPGITSAIGGLCYAGIPITHRDFASSFHVITGHLKDDNEELNWEALSKLKGTLVFLMGMSNLKKITDNLIKNGKDKNTPVAIINWATRYNQKVVEGNLSNIYEVVLREKVSSPSLIAVGEVVSLRNKLDFFGNKLLMGKNIVVTRSRAQNSSLIEKIENLGGNAIEFPTINIKTIEENKQLESAINNIERYSHIIFTSSNAVNIFLEKLFKLNYDSRILYNTKIVSIGKSTQNELLKFGLKADIIPEKFTSESVYDKLKDILNSNDNILIPNAKEARTYLEDNLRKMCNVEVIKTYENVVGDSKKENIIDQLKNKEIDYITFTSSSTVRNLIKIIGVDNIELLKNTKLISIGPVTTETINEYELNLHKQADEYTIDGIVNKIINDIKEG